MRCGSLNCVTTTGRAHASSTWRTSAALLMSCLVARFPGKPSGSWQITGSFFLGGPQSSGTDDCYNHLLQQTVDSLMPTTVHEPPCHDCATRASRRLYSVDSMFKKEGQHEIQCKRSEEQTGLERSRKDRRPVSRESQTAFLGKGKITLVTNGILASGGHMGAGRFLPPCTGEPLGNPQRSPFLNQREGLALHPPSQEEEKTEASF